MSRNTWLNMKDVNFRLFAMAPELLEALKRINDTLTGLEVSGMEPPSDPQAIAILWSDARTAYRIARAAVEKAEGTVKV